MQFLSMIRINENSGKRPDERLMSDMGKLMEEMMAAGVLLDTAGLTPTSAGKRLRLRDGRISQTDGPFTETKEVIGGYAVLEAPSMQEALAASRRFLDVHGPGWDIECELREIVRHPDGSGC
ncbi:YciI family protein [Rhodanobacter ginsengiterrae]|uniref:YciI family protein n=1 Tax=Rhodanobacter ginsengiterrae TaxID=2008451 RepID=UPI003CE72308